MAWVGYDQPKTLGRNETGGSVALPIWISYMGAVLKGVAEVPLDAPPGLVGSGTDAVYQENGPRGEGGTPTEGAPGSTPAPAPDSARNQLF